MEPLFVHTGMSMAGSGVVMYLRLPQLTSQLLPRSRLCCLPKVDRLSLHLCIEHCLVSRPVQCVS